MGAEGLTSSASVKSLFVFSCNLSFRLRASALNHPEDDCLCSPVHWGLFWRACRLRRSEFSVMVNSTSRTVASEI